MKQRQLAQMTLDDPAIHSVTAFAGGGRGGSNNVGYMFVALKPLEDRPGASPRTKWSTACAASSPAFREPRCFSRSIRIFRSADAAARRNTSTRSPTRT